MLDKRRIRLMSRMALYEKESAKEDLKISSYYKRDYTSLNTLISIMWITVGYVMAAALIVLCNLDSLLENLTITKMFLIAAIAVAGYLVLVIIYCVFVSSFYADKHNSAKRRVKKYYRDLARLEKMGIKEK